MAPHAADPAPSRWDRIADLLAPSPGRLEFAVRLASISALVALIAEVYQTPEPWLSIYIVFFMLKPDRTMSIVLGAVMTILVAILIGLLFLIATQVVDDPLKRVVAMGVLSFGLLFLGSASKLKPVASIIALVVVYALDGLGAVPSGEIATRALLYAWLFVGIPAGVVIAVNAVFGPSPRRLVERALAERLRLGAAMLGTPDASARKAFADALREGPAEIPEWLRAASLERTSPPGDIAALAQASRSTAVILELIDLACRSPGARWPEAVRARLRGTLAAMAVVLDRGGYPVDVNPGADDDRALAPLAARALSTLRAVLARFAEPPPADAAPARGETTGFFNDDAFTNPAHVYYALKTTAAALFCYFVYSVTDWPGIHTCLITCYIVALETTAETIEKITLRIIGCLIGAALGVATILFVMPHLTSIGGLMAVVFAGSAASAWIAAGSPRIAYVGFQFALAFYICVAQGFGPSFDFSSIRDRIVGILFGELVIAAIFLSVRPVSVSARIDRAIPALLRRLAALADATGPVSRDHLVAEAQTGLDAIAQDLAIAAYEPRSILPPPVWFDQRRAMVADLMALPAPMLLLPAPDEALRKRVERIADALTGGTGAAIESPGETIALSHPEAADPVAAALRPLIDRPLASLERIAAEETRAYAKEDFRYAPA